MYQINIFTNIKDNQNKILKYTNHVVIMLLIVGVINCCLIINYYKRVSL
jgi:hypothetical protein